MEASVLRGLRASDWRRTAYTRHKKRLKERITKLQEAAVTAAQVPR